VAGGADIVIRERIEATLQRVESQFGVKVVYACESGSRAWGFASPDSDYDVRFLFLRSRREYLSVRGGLETLEFPLDGNLDVVGWDVKKAARLLGKSNGALVEWLHSPVVYRAADGFLERWRATTRIVFSERASADHYRGLAKQMLRTKLTGNEVRAKDCLYALRAILAAKWILSGRGVAPVRFEELLPVASKVMAEAIPSLLQHKAASSEGERIPRMESLHDELQRSLEEIEDEIAARTDGPIREEALDQLLRGTLRDAARDELNPVWTLERVRSPELLLFDAVAGSHAYGTAIQSSDEDRRGVFVAPRSYLLGLDRIEQVSGERNDETYFELGRFIDLLLKNNPNALELLGIPEDCIRFCHPLFRRLEPGVFLSKLCARTYGEYAMGQIRKARGLNKKIVNPQPEARSPLLDFCHVLAAQGSVPVLAWLRERGLTPRDCGLTAVRHAPGLFAIYHEPGIQYRGMISLKDPDTLVFSSVSPEAEPIGWMHCHEDAFKAHTKAHREYWEWVELRNEARFATNSEHGRGYDSKNLMHTLRLLAMAGEIAREGILRVRRPDRDDLLRVRAGEFSYESLVEKAELMLEDVQRSFASSGLPDEPDPKRANELLLEIREEFGG